MRVRSFRLWATVWLSLCPVVAQAQCSATASSIAALKRQAAGGNAGAQCVLGVDYHNGQGVHKDDRRAAVWFGLAAAQGVAAAQEELGELYYAGQGVPQDYAEAAVWDRKAAEQGDADAQYNLGVLYYTGKGVPQDYTKAAEWYRRAAERGDADAQNSLGALYAQGQGVPQDYAKAYFWFDLAAAGKPDTSDAGFAQKNRDLAASHLTPSDLSREQDRAKKWFQEHATCTACLGQALRAKSASTAQIEPKINSGAAVYIEPMGGYENYLAAAFMKEHVPLVLVADKDKAEYIITGSLVHKSLSSGPPAVVVNNTAVGIGEKRKSSFARQVWEKDSDAQLALGKSLASIEVTDAHSSQILFACTEGKTGTSQLQKTAEGCAKHLKRFIEKESKK